MFGNEQSPYLSLTYSIIYKYKIIVLELKTKHYNKFIVDTPYVKIYINLILKFFNNLFKRNCVITKVL